MKFIYYPLVLLWLPIFGQVVLWFGQAKYTLYLSEGTSELERKFLALYMQENTTLFERTCEANGQPFHHPLLLSQCICPLCC